jgi:hypothetical protein
MWKKEMFSVENAMIGQEGYVDNLCARVVNLARYNEINKGKARTKENTKKNTLRGTKTT